MQQHREPRRPLNKSADDGAVEPENQVALPVPWHRAVLRLGRALADEDLGGDERLASSTAPRSRHAQRPACPQALRQLTLQRSPTLDVERLIDRLMADPHRGVVRIVEPQSVGDLLRAPSHTPASVLTPPATPSLPRHYRASNCAPSRSHNRTSQPLLHIRPQCHVRHEFRYFRPTRRPLRMPLRRRRPIVQAAAPRRRVPPQFTRHGGRCPPKATRNFPHTSTPSPPECNLLPLRKAQLPPREQLILPGKSNSSLKLSHSRGALHSVAPTCH